MPSTYLFKLQVKPHLPPIALRVVLVPDKINIDYSIGSYHPMLEMQSNGDFAEVVFREEKVIENIFSCCDEGRQFEKVINSVEGKILNAHRSNFVVGAGNGIFGMGITKTERLPDCFFTVIATKNKFIMFDLAINNDQCILMVRYNPLTKEAEISQSPFAMLQK